jgi:hypothetical protein
MLGCVEAGKRRRLRVDGGEGEGLSTLMQGAMIFFPFFFVFPSCSSFIGRSVGFFIVNQMVGSALGVLILLLLLLLPLTASRLLTFCRSFNMRNLIGMKDF